MKVAALQMVSTPDVDDNLAQAQTLIAQAAAEGAELVALPEYFCLMGHRDADKITHAEALGAGPIQASLAAAARRHGVWVVGGTLPLKVQGDVERVSNSVLAFDPQGQLAARYDKIHLFRFDDGQQSFDESRVLRAGTQPVSFVATDRAGQSWRVGLSVCYDLRFPELYRHMMVPHACDLLLVPAAFTYTTGQAHWELLLRARAVENQAYVMAPAQGGQHANGRRTWGHSLLIDPWGKVEAVLSDGAGVVSGTLSRARLDQVRTQLPALGHRVLG